MKIEVNIEKKHFFALVFLMSLVIGIVGVFAYNIASTSSTNPAVFGHTINEINIVNDSGQVVTLADYMNKSIKQQINDIKDSVDNVNAQVSVTDANGAPVALTEYIQDSIQNAVTSTVTTSAVGSCTTLFNTGNAEATKARTAINIPASCKTGLGCRIKQTIYRVVIPASIKTAITRPTYTSFTYAYNQDPDTNVWRSSAGTGTNGASNNVDIIPPYLSSTLRLMSDYSGVETSPNQWVYYDGNGGSIARPKSGTKYWYGMTIQTCPLLSG